MIFAIDPGNIYSAYAVLEVKDKELILPEFGKIENDRMLSVINKYPTDVPPDFVLEMIAHYGKDMNAGKEVFDTCVWIGRFQQYALDSGLCDANMNPPRYIYRKDEKVNLCGSMTAKDRDIRRVLIDRFAKHDLKNGKGTKKNPDVFYGVSADVWAAIAVGVTYHDINMLEAKEGGNE